MFTYECAARSKPHPPWYGPPRWYGTNMTTPTPTQPPITTTTTTTATMSATATTTTTASPPTP